MGFRISEGSGVTEKAEISIDVGATLRRSIPCPFVYADGRSCKGHIVHVEAYNADISWSAEADGSWTFDFKPGSHYHVFCSKKKQPCRPPPGSRCNEVLARRPAIATPRDSRKDKAAFKLRQRPLSGAYLPISGRATAELEALRPFLCPPRRELQRSGKLKVFV